jgi:hypothetical protein
VLALTAAVLATETALRAVIPAPLTPQSARRAVLQQIPIPIVCSTLLGQGVRSGVWFCDVLAGVDPASAPKVRLPPHRGTATLSFDLHNRHAFFGTDGHRPIRYAATVHVLQANGASLGRDTVETEVRDERAVVDRVVGGAGHGNAKLTAPVGRQTVRVTVPDGVMDVRVVGLRLAVDRAGNREVVTTPGRPIAVISNARVEYSPLP